MSERDVSTQEGIDKFIILLFSKCQLDGIKHTLESFEKRKKRESLSQRISSELRASIDKIPAVTPFRAYIRICVVSCVYIKDISSRGTIG